MMSALLNVCASDMSVCVYECMYIYTCMYDI